jgi:hypothetical protein
MIIYKNCGGEIHLELNSYDGDDMHIIGDKAICEKCGGVSINEAIIAREPYIAKILFIPAKAKLRTRLVSYICPKCKQKVKRNHYYDKYDVDCRYKAYCCKACDLFFLIPRKVKK